MIKIEEIISDIEKAKKWDHDINYSEKPLLYELTEDCGGMYTCEPYKTKIIKHWKFTNVSVSTSTASVLHSMFLDFLREEDLVGSDMIRKYFQAGSKRRVIPEDCRKIF